MTPSSSSASSPIDFYFLFINEEIYKIAVKYTNEKAQEVFESLSDEKKKTWKWKPVSLTEMKAFVGLLLLSGCHHENRASVKYLWAKMESSERPFYSATMPRQRFESIARFLRFDHKPERETKRTTDKLVLFREINDIFVHNLKTNYNPSEHICCDECLVAFDGICPFKVFMKSKPDKSGIKVWTLADCATNYVLNIQVYTGKF